ncbi:MAG: hypothetical protein RMM17_04540 [Acidobacteriota bacterium]|nr:hypothetical protein [Blastocatellia bacterium]MDW8411931.1 hypothetical protein [Acidobacteriota bacterium]
MEAQKQQGYHVQGSLIKARILYIHVNHGASALKEVLALLPEDLRGMLSKPVYIGEWYPLALLTELDRAIVNLLGQGNERVHEELGSFSADINLSGAYEPLVHQDIHEFLRLTAFLHRNYQDFGEARYIKLGETAALLQFSYPQAPPEAFCKSGAGYFRRAVELCGGLRVSVKIAACMRLGDPKCEFRIEWST